MLNITLLINMAPKSKITKNFITFLISSFYKDEVKKDLTDWYIYKKEAKLMGDIYLKYPVEEFWLMWKPKFKINSFAFFKTPDGKNEIEKTWRYYKMEKKYIINESDSQKFVIDNLEKNDNNQVDSKPVKQDVFEWADSK